MSDTHNHLGNVTRIVELLNAAGVDRVVHTGDITQAKTLEVLARLDAPLHGVYGNNDIGERESLERAASHYGISLVDPPLQLRWADRRLCVVHDPRDFEPVLEAAGAETPSLVLHGHDHRFRLERRETSLRSLTTIFNPGECAGHMKGRNAVGVVDLDDLSCERLFF